MRKFDRIITDYRKLGGLPYFRDTSITVSEVVRLVMDGKSNADILAQYPDLKPDDIQEALAFAVQDVLEQIAAWANEGRNPINIIQGFSALLADDESSEINIEETRKYAEGILRSSGRVAHAWAYLSSWSQLSYGQGHSYLTKSESLLSVIQVVKSFLTDPRSEATAEFNVPNDSYSIHTTGTLSTALTNLIEDRGFGQLESHAILDMEISHAESILFRIRRRYNEHIYDLMVK